MNKLYCRMCGYETTKISDYCTSCSSTMILIVPITYRPPYSDVEEREDGMLDRSDGGGE